MSTSPHSSDPPRSSVPADRAVDAVAVGDRMHALIERLYPYCRSITGDGVRATLDVVGETIPLERVEVPSGTVAFDWVVPPEWNIRGAHVTAPDGRRVVDFADHNLHVVSYSAPVRRTMSLDELRPHLHSLPELPDRIPHRTSYFREDWGFCLRHRDLEALEPGEYEVVVDSTLAPGALSYGEWFLPGASTEEFLLSCHVCHPSLCNDNLSGIALAAELAAHLATRPRRLSYRLLLVPGTIGSITWLARNPDVIPRIGGGLVLNNAGDPGELHYKRSRQGDARVDRAVLHVLAAAGVPYHVRDFEPYGYDERQYSSPGIGLAVGSLTRTPYGRFDEYHTSADDLGFVRPDALGDTFRRHVDVLELIDRDTTYRNLNPCGEPRLGDRGLYALLGGRKGDNSAELAVLWVLNLSDGHHSLLDVAERSGLSFSAVSAAADALVEVGLLEAVPA